MKAKVGIIGGAGYTGGELIRLLLQHPFVEISEVVSRSHAQQPLYAAHPDLVGETDLVFSPELSQSIDVLFLCLGHGESVKWLQQNRINTSVKLIDLTNDFRLSENATIADRSFVYGLPEINRSKISTASSIANPGCFATAIQLGLLPLLQTDVLSEVHTTGITGSTGAGQSLSATSHFSWRVGNIQAYKTLTHQHLAEVRENLPGVEINFIPWRGDFSRGIFVSSTIHTDLSEVELLDLYNQFYNGHPFTHISKTAIYLKQVVQTNKCLIQLEKIGSKLVVHSIIDNLLKGASGQAVQNMNLLMGWEETAGLKLKPAGF